MSGAGSTSSQQFQVAQILAPPAVLLRQLQKLDTDESLNVLATLLQNPALLARVLDAQARAIKLPQGLPDRLNQLEPEWLMRALRNSALQQVLQNEQSDTAFIQVHWQLSRYAALIAGELATACSHPEAGAVASSAFLLRMGMLVLEQQHGHPYSTLVLAHTNQAALLRAEQETFGIDHIIAGERLVELWQLDPFCIDAMRYQALSAEAIMDAAPLVKICWFANYLVNNTQLDAKEIPILAENLFSLSPSFMNGLLGRVRAQYVQECAAYGMGTVRAAEQDSTRLQIEHLKQYVVSSTILAALAMEPSDTVNSLKALLVNLLLEAGIEPKFIVFAQDKASTPFRAITSNNVHHNAESLSFVCSTGRNLLSEIVANGGFIISGGYASLADSSLALTPKELTVIDRQLLGLLGGQTVLCETVSLAGAARALLLIGIPYSSGNQYLARSGVRKLIRSKIAGFIQGEGGESQSVSTTLYQQRVREAVHEANNPLTIIKNYLQILSMKQGEHSQTSEDIILIKSEIDRVARILISLRETREPDVNTQQINLNQLLEKMRLMFTSAPDEGKNVAIKFDLAATAPSVWGKPDAVKQIVTNLVKNAAEAINKNGSIRLVTRGNVYLRDEIFVQLCVADDGPGIAPQVMAKLFTAGTSTKGGLHTGTGLAIVNKLVADMHGQISCQSDNNGTLFSILLPQVR